MLTSQDLNITSRRFLNDAAFSVPRDVGLIKSSFLMSNLLIWILSKKTPYFENTQVRGQVFKNLYTVFSMVVGHSHEESAFPLCLCLGKLEQYFVIMFYPPEVTYINSPYTVLRSTAPRLPLLSFCSCS